MLAELHALPAGTGVIGRPGGGWHHLVDGTGPDEVAAAQALLAGCADRVAPADQAAYAGLRRELDCDVDDGAGLRQAALTHPDFALANVVAPATGGMVVTSTGPAPGPEVARVDARVPALGGSGA